MGNIETLTAVISAVFAACLVIIIKRVKRNRYERQSNPGCRVDKKFVKGTSVGILLGISFGVLFGIAVHNVALGSAIGPGVGLAMGKAFSNKFKEKEKEKQANYAVETVRSRNSSILSIVALLGIIVLILVLVLSYFFKDILK